MQGLISKISKVLIVGVATFVGWNYFELSTQFFPCRSPITYSIGSFDRRFGLSEQDFLEALSQAESIWEKPLGKELFSYVSQEGEVNINLVYDYRQEVTSTLSGLEDVVENNKDTYDLLQTEYERLKKEFDSKKLVYEARLVAFEEENRSYQRLVDDWNSGPRNSQKKFNQLESERIALEEEVRELKSLEFSLNSLARDINSLVSRLNNLAQSLNLTVDKYNTIGASRGDTFTGGLYYSDGNSRDIDIYEFSSNEKLVRIMAHELGHALGLDHVDDPEAIMYELNKGDKDVLSNSDLAILKQLCRIK